MASGMAVDSSARVAVDGLCRNGWCTVAMDSREAGAVQEATAQFNQFFLSPFGHKEKFRRCAGRSFENRKHKRGCSASSRVLPTAGVGFLSGPTRQWFHLVAGAMEGMSWPEALQPAIVPVVRPTGVLICYADLPSSQPCAASISWSCANMWLPPS